MSFSMNIGSTLPAQNIHLFRARRASFIRRMSPLNPSASPVAASSTLKYQKPETSTDLTRLHLANLEKLLQIPAPQSQLDPQPLQKDPSNNGSRENKGRSPLEGLNLAGLWSEVKAAEEMSPRHLNRLQRLLSKTNEYSPRNNLGSKWHEYHGSNNWKGLLDPLDGNLRREVVRYGEFVQAAYHSFHSNPAMPTEEPPLPRHVALPDRSYKVTKSLYATSSIRLPDMAPDWMAQRSSWIGYVAVCDNEREIQRMGRRDIVIALRGTATCLEWTENVRAQLVQIPENNNNNNNTNNNKNNKTDSNPTQGHSNSKVECGFLSLYKTPGTHVPSLSESVVEEVQRLIDQYKGENLSITITGHSLGAALAVLVADEISTCTSTTLNMPPIAVFSFGGPRVGNKAFANRIDAQNVKVLRIVNSQDVITRIPGVFIGEELSQKLRNTSILGQILDMLDKNMPLAYSDVGMELRVDTKMSPYLKPNADMACCHDLEAYLHLVDGFLASNCPFRANAKRNLGRLLKDQGSNVKKLYIKLERDGLPTSSCLPSPS